MSAPPRETAPTAGDRGWVRLKPALVLWVALLATNGIAGLLSWVVDGTSPWLDLVITLVDCAIIVAFCRASRADLVPLCRVRRLRSLRSLATVPVFIGIAAFMILYLSALELLGLGTVSNVAPFIEHGWPLWTAFVLCSIVPGIIEELAFRGQIMGRLDRVLRPGDALVVQAAMFSVLHMSPSIFLSHFVAGLALGWLRRFTESLYPGMVVHMAWNASVLWMELAVST